MRNYRYQLAYIAIPFIAMVFTGIIGLLIPHTLAIVIVLVVAVFGALRIDSACTFDQAGFSFVGLMAGAFLTTLFIDGWLIAKLLVSLLYAAFCFYVAYELWTFKDGVRIRDLKKDSPNHRLTLAIVSSGIGMMFILFIGLLLVSILTHDAKADTEDTSITPKRDAWPQRIHEPSKPSATNTPLFAHRKDWKLRCQDCHDSDGETYTVRIVSSDTSHAYLRFPWVSKKDTGYTEDKAVAR